MDGVCPERGKEGGKRSTVGRSDGLEEEEEEGLLLDQRRPPRCPQCYIS